MYRKHRKSSAWVLGFVLWAAAAWSQDPAAAAWQTLTRGLSETQSLKRANAVAALGNIGKRPEVVRLIEGGLGDKEPSVRRVAAAELGELKARESMPKLRQALDDRDADVALAAAKALWDMGDKGGRNMLCQLLARQRAGSAGMVQSNVADAKKMMQNRSSLALMGIKEGVSVFGPFGLGISLVEELRKDRAAPACLLSASLLASDDDPQSKQALEAALADKNWIVRAAAARALGSRGNRDSVARLQPLLQDPKDMVRYTAAASIVRLARPRP